MFDYVFLTFVENLGLEGKPRELFWGRRGFQEAWYNRGMKVPQPVAGSVLIPAGASPWPHEERVARILSRAGFRVEFIPETTIKTPDIYLNRTEFEIKSPKSNKIDAVERNITRALAKCPNVVFDSYRMKLRDEQIRRELIKLRRAGKGLKKVIFVTKRGEVIDINALI